MLDYSRICLRRQPTPASYVTMSLTSISCLVCPSTGHIVSLRKLLAKTTAVVVTLIQSDHPADTRILPRRPAHPSFRPLTVQLTLPLCWQVTQNNRCWPERAATSQSPSSANMPNTGWVELWGVLRTILSASRGEGVGGVVYVPRYKEVKEWANQLALD